MARVKSDWLIPLPKGLTAKQAMGVGTAGYTAMLSVMALERHGMKPQHGPAVVTGASGGVGSGRGQRCCRSSAGTSSPRPAAWPRPVS